MPQSAAVDSRLQAYAASGVGGGSAKDNSAKDSVGSSAAPGIRDPRAEIAAQKAFRQEEYDNLLKKVRKHERRRRLLDFVTDCQNIEQELRESRRQRQERARRAKGPQRVIADPTTWRHLLRACAHEVPRAVIMNRIRFRSEDLRRESQEKLRTFLDDRIYHILATRIPELTEITLTKIAGEERGCTGSELQSFFCQYMDVANASEFAERIFRMILFELTRVGILSVEFLDEALEAGAAMTEEGGVAAGSPSDNNNYILGLSEDEQEADERRRMEMDEPSEELTEDEEAFLQGEVEDSGTPISVRKKSVVKPPDDKPVAMEVDG